MVSSVRLPSGSYWPPWHGQPHPEAADRAYLTQEMPMSVVWGRDDTVIPARHAEVADAAHAILSRPAQGFSGNFLLDEDVLREAGVADIDRYAVDPSKPLLPDLFLD